MNRVLEFVLRRPGIVFGAIAAVLALGAVIDWSEQGYVVIQTAIAWVSLLMAALALLTVTERATRGRAIAAIVIGVFGFGFWLGVPEFAGPPPVYAYLVTAAAIVGLGILVPPQDAKYRRSTLIACAGAIVFTVVGVGARLGG